MAKQEASDVFLTPEEPTVGYQQQQRQSCVVFAHGDQETMQLQALPEKIRFVSVAFTDYLKSAGTLQELRVASPSAAAACPAVTQAVVESAESAAVFNHVFVPELNTLVFHLAALTELAFSESDPSPSELKECVAKLKERIDTVSQTSRRLSNQLVGSGDSLNAASHQLRGTEVSTLESMVDLHKREQRDSKRSFWLGVGGVALVLLGAPLLVFETPALLAGAAISGARVGVGVAAMAGAGASAGGAKVFASKAAKSLTVYKSQGGLLEGVQKMHGPTETLSDGTRKLLRGLEKIDALLTMLSDRVQECVDTPGINLGSLALFKLLQLAQVLGSPTCYLQAHEVEVDMLLADREAADVVNAWKQEQRQAEAAAAAATKVEV